MTKSKDLNSLRASIPFLWFHGYYLAAAEAAIIAVDDDPEFVAFMVDNAIIDLMSKRYNDVRGLVEEAIHNLLVRDMDAEANRHAS